MKSLFTDNTRREQWIKTAILILAGIAILLGATFAWRDLSQHKTNPWGDGRDTNTRNVTLNDEFIPPKTIVEGEEIPKTVSVSNLADSGGLACVRLSLKEFMELRKHQTEEYYTDEAGVNILFATFADGSARQGEYMTVAEAEALGFQHYGAFPVPQGFDILNPDPDKRRLPLMVEYATTNIAEPQNGIYGKPMLIPGELIEMWGDAPRANLNHSTASTAECDYTPYFWDDQGAPPLIGEHTMDGNPDPLTTGPLRDYVTLNGAPVMTLQAWSTNEGKTEVGNGHLGDVWVVDEEDGWVYWANRIEPGTTTANLLDSVTFTKNPATLFPGTNQVEYYIHVDMHATDETEAEVVGVFGDVDDVDDPNVDTLEEVKPHISPAKYDLLEKLINGQHEVTFVDNLPQGVDPAKLSGMPTPNPQRVSWGNLLTEPAKPSLRDTDYRFLFWSTNKDDTGATLDHRFDFTNPITQDVKLYAVWQIPFRVKLKVDDPITGSDHPDQNLLRQVTLNVLAGGGNDFTIDWGAAGSKTGSAGTLIPGTNLVRYTGTVAAKTVQYQYDSNISGEVTIEIFGTMPASMRFSWSDSNSTSGETRLKSVLTPMLPSPKKDNFSKTFHTCIELTAIPADLFANNPQVMDFGGAFEGCSKLETIPEDLFAHNPEVENFQNTFMGCSGLTAIPDGLFANNPNVTIFFQTFRYCDSLTTIPKELFQENKKVTNFSYTFWGCTLLTSGPALWDPHYVDGWDPVKGYPKAFQNVPKNYVGYRANGDDGYPKNPPSGWN